MSLVDKGVFLLIFKLKVVIVNYGLITFVVYTRSGLFCNPPVSDSNVFGGNFCLFHY